MNSFIENLNGRGETFLTFVWPMLWQSSLLIAVLLAFDFLVRRKVRASVRYTLWLVVLLKLCLPPTLALPTSPAWWLHKAPAPVAAKPEIHYTVTYDTTPMPEAPAEPLPVYVPPKPSLTTAAWLLSASIAVSASLLLWLLARWWQITRLVRRAAASERLTALAAEAQRIVGMKMKVRVKLTTNAMSPAVCGLFRPAILIPQPLAENFSDEQMRAVLLHELIHLRRRDVWMNFLQALLQIAYWWHPLVWLANARIRRVREEAVDDAVMLALNDGAEAYAPTLLEVAKLALNRPLVSLGLVGIMESRNALRQRIERLLDFHPPRQAGLTLVSLLGVLAFTAVAVPMGQGPVPTPANPEATPTTVTTPGEASATAPSTNDVLSALADPNPQITLHELEAILTNQNFRAVLDEMEKKGAYRVDRPPAPVTLASASTIAWTNLLADPNFRVALHALEQRNGFESNAGLPVARSGMQSGVQTTRIQGNLASIPAQTVAVGQSAAAAGTNVPQILITAYFCEALAPDLKEFEKSLRFNVDTTGQNLWVPLPADQFGPVHDRLSAPAFHRLSTPRVVTLNGEAAQMHMGNGTNSTDFSCTPVITNGRVNLTFDFQVVRPQAGITVTNRFHTVETLESQGGILVKAADAQGTLQSNVMVLARVEIITNFSARFQPRLQKIIRSAGGTNTAEPAYTAQHQKIVTQLVTIRLAQFLPFKEETLENVVQRLSQAIRQQNTNSEGISFLITGPDTNHPPRLDPATGLPVVPATPPVDARLALVHLNTPMENLTVMDILDRVVMTAVPPVKYSIADYGVVFSARSPEEIAGMFTRTYRVDKNTFYNGMKQMGGAGAATNSSTTISETARNFFTSLGVNLDSPAGKAVFYNEGNSLLFVKATESDQDTIDRAIQTLNQIPPQVHIKVRFLEMPHGQGADVYLGKMKQIPKVATTTPGATPGAFPGNGTPSSSVTPLSVPGGSLPATGGTNAAQITGILTDSDFRTILKTLNSKEGVEYLGEPEVTTMSGRQCQMRATQVVTVITNFVLQENPTNDATTVSPQMTAVETGPVFDVVPHVMSDGYTINLAVNPCFIEFLGYVQTNAAKASYTRSGKRVDLPVVLPNFRVQQSTATANVWDGQTLVIGGMSLRNKVKDKVPVLGSVPLMGKLFQSENSTTNEILVFVTATIVDPAGNRVHTDEESSHFQIKAAPDDTRIRGF